MKNIPNEIINKIKNMANTEESVEEESYYRLTPDFSKEEREFLINFGRNEISKKENEQEMVNFAAMQLLKEYMLKTIDDIKDLTKELEIEGTNVIIDENFESVVIQRKKGRPKIYKVLN